jgi:Lon protease-like protein
MVLPNAVPVMPLPGAILFPHALLPLFIFEPRYREMLAHALARDRMFSVALLKVKRSDWHSPDDFHHVATVGLIRACVGRGDGTSHLILQGLRRVRFTAFEQETPFPIAEIEAIDSLGADRGIESEALATKVLDLYEKFKRSGREFPARIDRYLADLTDPEMLGDLMAATFIGDPFRRQQLLEETSVNQRLRLLIKYLSEENGDVIA